MFSLAGALSRRFPFLFGFALAALFLTLGGRATYEALRPGPTAALEVDCDEAATTRTEWVRIHGCWVAIEAAVLETENLDRRVKEVGLGKVPAGEVLLPLVGPNTPTGASAIEVSLTAEADKRAVIEWLLGGGLPKGTRPELAALLTEAHPTVAGTLQETSDSSKVEGASAPSARRLLLGGRPPPPPLGGGLAYLLFGAAIFAFVFVRWRRNLAIASVPSAALPPGVTPLDAKQLFAELDLKLGEHDELRSGKKDSR